MHRISMLAAMTMAAQPCFAQSTAPPDTAAILQAIQGLRDELKATNKRIDKLQERDRPVPSRSAPAAAATPNAAPATQPAGEAQHGWLIYLEPYTEDGKGFSVLGFHGPANDFNFDLHSRYNNSQNRFIYHGVSTFHPKSYGEYTFQLTLQPVLAPTPNSPFGSYRFNCSGEVRVNGNILLTAVTSYQDAQRPERTVWESQDYYGRAILEPLAGGKGHQIEYRVDCWPNAFRKTTYYDFLLSSWKSNQFQVRVKAPTDMGPRPFARDELYFIAQR